MKLTDIDVVPFASESTEEAVTLMLGYEPAFVILFSQVTATSPDIVFWVHPDYNGQMADADGSDDDVMFLTGSTGVVTIVDDGIAAHAGGTTITSSNDENFRYQDGSAVVVADTPVSKKGITIGTGLQANSGKNIAICFRAGR